MVPNRNDLCPCGSGKKYKKCCGLNKHITIERVFSYRNYRLTYSYSPVFTLDDWNKLKNSDGSIATPSASTHSIPQYLSKTYFGYNLYPEIVTRIQNTPDHTFEEIAHTPELYTQFIGTRNFDLMLWPYEFNTIALIDDDNHPGFALVSHTGDRFISDFSIRSEWYPITKQEKIQFKQYLASLLNFFPIGQTFKEVDRDVYTFSYDTLEEYIKLYHKTDLCLSVSDAQDLYNNYLCDATDGTSGRESQYEAETEEDINFWRLARLYRKHCIELVEFLCSESSMKQSVRMRETEEELTKTQIQLSDTEAKLHEAETRLEKLVQSSSSNRDLKDQIENSLIFKYAKLAPNTFNFLVNAETMYQLNVSSSDELIGWESVAQEYSLVLETQLRYFFLKNEYGTGNAKQNLGDFLFYIEANRVMPLYNRLAQLRYIMNIRNPASHEGVADKARVDTIRRYYFDNKLLEQLFL